jgi:hypothetical protein
MDMAALNLLRAGHCAYRQKCRTVRLAEPRPIR